MVTSHDGIRSQHVPFDNVAVTAVGAAASAADRQCRDLRERRGFRPHGSWLKGLIPRRLHSLVTPTTASRTEQSAGVAGRYSSDLTPTRTRHAGLAAAQGDGEQQCTTPCGCSSRMRLPALYKMTHLPCS